jgi:hypothetical protein
MKARKKREIKFVICIVDSEPDLEIRKVYKVLPDHPAEKEGHLRVIDESGEDYLYPVKLFVPVEVSEEAERALSLAS